MSTTRNPLRICHCYENRRKRFRIFRWRPRFLAAVIGCGTLRNVAPAAHAHRILTWHVRDNVQSAARPVVCPGSRVLYLYMYIFIFKWNVTCAPPTPDTVLKTKWLTVRKTRNDDDEIGFGSATYVWHTASPQPVISSLNQSTRLTTICQYALARIRVTESCIFVFGFSFFCFSVFLSFASLPPSPPRCLGIHPFRAVTDNEKWITFRSRHKTVRNNIMVCRRRRRYSSNSNKTVKAIRRQKVSKTTGGRPPHDSIAGWTRTGDS